MLVSDPVLATGLLLLTGFLFGRLTQRMGLPSITGYILAGLLLNPHVFPILPQNFDVVTSPITDICLAFITFEIGSELKWERIRKAGARVLALTAGESLGAWLCVIIGLLALSAMDGKLPGVTGQFLQPMVLIMASLAAPTDPSATLAVRHEYQARGPVSDTIAEVAAFDDLMGIVLFSIGVHTALVWLGVADDSGWSVVLEPLRAIGGAIGIGAIAGLGFIRLGRLLGTRAEGGYIVLLLAVLALAYGVARVAGLDSVLATMTMGVVIGNFHPHRALLIRMIQRYTEELVFVFFFTLGATHLDPTIAVHMLPLALCFVLLRAVGKLGGFALVGRYARLEAKVLRLAPLGLLPQGGIVIGLALSVQQNPAFETFSQVLLSVVMAATIVHEVIGPIVTRMALRRAGEIHS